MSGQDERPVLVVKEDERIECPNCGGTMWEQIQSYSNILATDLESGLTHESDVEWYDASEWLCANCGNGAPRYIAVKLGRLT